MREAPLFVDAYDLAIELCSRLDSAAKSTPLATEVLTRRIVSTALGLLDEVSLALKGFDQEYHAGRADELLAVLRVQARLAMDLGVLKRNHHLAMAERMEGIGRQLGGWLKRLRPV